MSDVTPNPSAIPADTSVEVWKMEMAAVRRQSVEQRLADAEKLNRRQRDLENQYLERRFPHLDTANLAVERVRLRYGNTLAEQVQDRLIAHHRKSSIHV